MREAIHDHFLSILKMQETFPPAVQTNAYTQVPYNGGVREHQVHFTQVNQGQVPPAVRTNTSTYAPFTGGVREHQAHFTPEVNQGQFHPTVQTNRSTHGTFSGGVRDHQIHQFAPQMNQVWNFMITSVLIFPRKKKIVQVQVYDFVSIFDIFSILSCRL
jgi:replication factor A2